MMHKALLYTLKHNFFICLGAIFVMIATSIIDWVFDTEITDRIDEVFTDNKDKTLPRNKRQEILTNYQKEKDKNISGLWDN